MSDVECITLDDSGDDSPTHSGYGGGAHLYVGQVPLSGGLHGTVQPPPPSHGLAAGYLKTLRPTVASIPVVREEQMMRCNLCVDPGLLPVEEDRAAHR